MILGFASYATDNSTSIRTTDQSGFRGEQRSDRRSVFVSTDGVCDCVGLGCEGCQNFIGVVRAGANTSPLILQSDPSGPVSQPIWSGGVMVTQVIARSSNPQRLDESQGLHYRRPFPF